MRGLRLIASLTLVSVGTAARPVDAQVSFGVAGLYASLSGNDFQGTNAGFGGDLQVRGGLGSSFSLGGGVQFTSHSTDISANWKVIGLFAEPRYLFKTSSSRVSPLLTGRLGWIRESISSGGNDGSASGYFFGFGGGMLVGLGGSAALDMSVVFASVNFGDLQVNGSNSGFSPSGTSLAIRAGLLFGRDPR
ncbi:MAG: hypothetical protein ACREMW_02675 [Gemmatimonadales bacterium]